MLLSLLCTGSIFKVNTLLSILGYVERTLVSRIRSRMYNDVCIEYSMLLCTALSKQNNREIPECLTTGCFNTEWFLL